MRKTPLVVIVVAFAAFLVIKAPGWLDKAPAQTYATPVAQPDSGGELAPVQVPKRQEACVDRIPFGPDARYVLVTVVTDGPAAGPLEITAKADGYAATARVAAGTPNNGQVVAPIAPAAREGLGTLCITNQGKREIGLYGVGGGANPSTTTVAGAVSDRDLSVTLLTSPSKSLGSRFGSLLHNAAAFNPLSPWLLWIVLALVLVGAPVGVGVALGRAAADDDQADSART